MTRYFFHTSGSAQFTDTIGTELADDDVAWSMAVSSMGELLRDLNGKMPAQSEIGMTVENSEGASLISLSFLAARR